MKKALITGITGQDGSYLAELLLEKGYEVHGIVRRSSTINDERISHLYKDPHNENVRLFLHYGDLTDGVSLCRILGKIQPDEVYNLGAQSHVRVSFDQPGYTVESVAMGTLNLLEAIRECGLKPRFYQASSSEMYGAVIETPQRETTPFNPQSPYACAKVFAHNIVANYRDAYHLHASSGILFNHETCAAFMPMFVRRKGEKVFDIKPIREIVEFDESNKEYQSKSVNNIQVWGKSGWVNVHHASAYPHNLADNKNPRFINDRSGAYMATADHIAFTTEGEKATKDLKIGDALEEISLPVSQVELRVSLEEAELLGMLVGDGHITARPIFTNCNPQHIERVKFLWTEVVGGTTETKDTPSGFNPEKMVKQTHLKGGSDWSKTCKQQIYTLDKQKRVPKKILNASKDVQAAFLKGYNSADGLKANKCTYEFKSFKTVSATLAMGIWYLIDCVTGQELNLTVGHTVDGNLCYSLDALSPDTLAEKIRTVKAGLESGETQRALRHRTGISRGFIRRVQQGDETTVHHLKKKRPEIKKIIEMPEYDGWFYDLATSSGEFHCGIGKIHVHNSPRRGLTFVTRKIARAVAKISLNKQKTLYLGNLEAKRDWGHAKDYVEAMWLMLQQNEPDDYVIATGETHSVREFVDLAFSHVGLKWADHVEIDVRYFRPTEVDLLIGDASKAREKLGWRPKVGFEELVTLMVDAELKAVATL